MTYRKFTAKTAAAIAVASIISLAAPVAAQETYTIQRGNELGTITLAPSTALSLKLCARTAIRRASWRADIVLAAADGAGTAAIMRRTGMSKPTVWRWQERYLDEGVPGLKRDKTRPSREFQQRAGHPPGRGGEIQLADALDVLARRERLEGCALAGERHDCGTHLGYLGAILATACAHSEIGPSFVDLIEAHLSARVEVA